MTGLENRNSFLMAVVTNHVQPLPTLGETSPFLPPFCSILRDRREMPRASRAVTGDGILYLRSLVHDERAVDEDRRCLGSGVRTGPSAGTSPRFGAILESRVSVQLLAMRSSPQVGFSAAISRISCRRSLGKRGLPVGFDFQRQNSRNPLRCHRMSVSGFTFTSAPRHSEHSAQGGHHPPGRIVGPSWFDLSLLEERQLLPKEEILRSQGAAGMRREESQSDQVDHDQGQRPEAVCNGAENR